MKIQVIKPSKKIALSFDVTKNERGRLIISIKDALGRKTSSTFDRIRNQVPSTLLSMWVNHYLGKELLELAGKGTSVEYQGGEGSWKFRENPEIYGLHDTVDAKGNIKHVRIDGLIGMRYVVAILEKVGYTVVSSFDEKTGHVTSIELIKESIHV